MEKIERTALKTETVGTYSLKLLERTVQIYGA